MRAGKGRVFQCLQQSLAQPDFGQACRAQVEERGQRMQVRLLHHLHTHSLLHTEHRQVVSLQQRLSLFCCCLCCC